MIEATVAEESRELERRERLYRGDRADPRLEGRVVILVDDGLATGATMRAAVRALRQYKPARLVVAVPVGAPETCAQFEHEADEVICGQRPRFFGAVGAWYADFTQITDEEVSSLLEHRAQELRVAAVLERKPQAYQQVLTHDG